jgi:hypothetical protein
MNRRVHIIKLGGTTRMYDAEDSKLLVELYDEEVDQEKTLVEFAQDLGYEVVYEFEYEVQQ